MAKPAFTTVAELIDELKKFPQDLVVCGIEEGGHYFAEKVNLYPDAVKVNDDGYIERFESHFHHSEDETKVLMLTFDRF